MEGAPEKGQLLGGVNHLLFLSRSGSVLSIGRAQFICKENARDKNTALFSSDAAPFTSKRGGVQLCAAVTHNAPN